MFRHVVRYSRSLSLAEHRFDFKTARIGQKLWKCRYSMARPELETRSVDEMDQLLRAIKCSVDPSHKYSMPLRQGLLWSEALSSPRDVAFTPGPAPSSLTPRRMHSSYSQILLPFKSNVALLEQYLNSTGGLRIGKLMEHLDSLAGSIAYKHLLGPDIETIGKISERGFYVVTAAVDRLDMLGDIQVVQDIILSGQVIYTGRSSMEIVVKMEGLESQATLMLGRFSMVCRDAYTHKSREVNPLELATDEERSLFAMGENHKNRRNFEQEHSLARSPPTVDEARDLHQLFLKYVDRADVNPPSVLMEKTRRENSLLMFPQERNVHQKIFGGYLMRLAYELGFTSATLFLQSQPRFLSLDGIAFKKPVSIGSILHLISHVTCTSHDPGSPPLVHVVVQANVVDPSNGNEQNTNDFRFTWGAQHNDPRRVVIPRTYKDAMMWLEGKRALSLGEEIRGLRQT